MNRFSFPKKEHLKGEKQFAELFSKGKSFHSEFFRVTWMPKPLQSESAPPVLSAFIVPKRNFKKAAQRNIIRRRMKEAYRLHKHILPSLPGTSSFQLIFTCVFTGKRECAYSEIESKIIVTLQRLVKESGIVSSPPATHDKAV